MKKIIIFMIRKRLGLAKYENFTFVGQKSKTYYFFNDEALIKVWEESGKTELSHVSLNYLLSDEVEIVRKTDG